MNTNKNNMKTCRRRSAVKRRWVACSCHRPKNSNE